MARPVVPKFGNWENEESVPYTVVFTNLRKNRGGKMINPNDPLEYPDMFPNMDPTPPAPPPSKPIRTRPNEPIGRGAVRPTPDHRVSTEDFDFRQSSNSPARSENIVQKSANESTHRNYGGRGARSNGPARQSAGSEYSIERSSNSPARSENIVQKSANESTHRNYGGHGARSNGPARQSAGSEYSIERSPLHPHYQAKVSGRGNGSFSLEGKNSYDSSHGTPGRSRLRPVTRGDETPDKSAAVPKFGIWNDDDPQSAKNFTQLFDDARKGRNMEPGNISGTPKLTSHNTPTHQYNKNQKKCCFPWF